MLRGYWAPNDETGVDIIRELCWRHSLRIADRSQRFGCFQVMALRTLAQFRGCHIGEVTTRSNLFYSLIRDRRSKRIAMRHH